MAKISAPLKLLGRGRRPARLDESAILLALASPVLVVDADNQIVYVNDATEQFFRLSANQLVDHRLADFIPAGQPAFLPAVSGQGAWQQHVGSRRNAGDAAHRYP